MIFCPLHHLCRHNGTFFILCDSSWLLIYLTLLPFHRCVWSQRGRLMLGQTICRSAGQNQNGWPQNIMLAFLYHVVTRNRYANTDNPHFFSKYQFKLWYVCCDLGREWVRPFSFSFFSTC